MTATTVSPNLPVRATNSALRLAVAFALMAVLVLGAFAIGRSTADTSEPAPAVSSSEATPANVPAVPDPASCGHTAHTPPC